MKRTLVAGLALGLGVFGASAAEAAITPYYNDFSASVADFTETTDARWIHEQGEGVYTNVITTGDQPASALLQVTDLGGLAATAQDFQVSTAFRINSITGAQTT